MVWSAHFHPSNSTWSRTLPVMLLILRHQMEDILVEAAISNSLYGLGKKRSCTAGTVGILYLLWLRASQQYVENSLMLSLWEDTSSCDILVAEEFMNSHSIQSWDWLGLPCPLPTDPPSSPYFLSIPMICCKCALFCSSFTSCRIKLSCSQLSVARKELFRLLFFQNENC